MKIPVLYAVHSGELYGTERMALETAAGRGRGARAVPDLLVAHGQVVEKLAEQRLSGAIALEAFDRGGKVGNRRRVIAGERKRSTCGSTIALGASGTPRSIQLHRRCTLTPRRAATTVTPPALLIACSMTLMRRITHAVKNNVNALLTTALTFCVNFTS